MVMKKIIILSIETAIIFSLCMCSKSSGQSKTTPIVYKSVIITADGGEYEITTGLKLSVPAGTVDADTTFEIARLDQSNMQPVFDSYEDSSFELITGFDIKPAAAVFHHPVTITITGTKVNPGFVPIVHTINLSNKTHSVEKASISYDPDNDSLAVSVNQGKTVAIEADRQWGTLSKNKESSCREGLITVESEDHEDICAVENCERVQSRVKVQFLGCPGQPIEDATLRESIGLCIPQLEISSQANKISTGSSTDVTAKIKLACTPVADQTVNFTVNGKGTINPVSGKTSAGGTTLTTLSSQNQEGTATVSAESVVRYPVREIIVNGIVEEAFYRSETAGDAISVQIEKNLTHYKVDFTFDIDNATDSDNFEDIVVLSNYHLTYFFTVDADPALTGTYSMYDDLVVANWDDGTSTQTLGSLVSTDPSVQVTDVISEASPFCEVQGFFSTAPVLSYLTIRHDNFIGANFWQNNILIGPGGLTSINLNGNRSLDEVLDEYKISGIPYLLQDGFNGNGTAYLFGTGMYAGTYSIKVSVVNK